MRFFGAENDFNAHGASLIEGLFVVWGLSDGKLKMFELEMLWKSFAEEKFYNYHE
jgi:hypothetical protein